MWISIWKKNNHMIRKLLMLICKVFQSFLINWRRHKKKGYSKSYNWKVGVRVLILFLTGIIYDFFFYISARVCWIFCVENEMNADADIRPVIFITKIPGGQNSKQICWPFPSHAHSSHCRTKNSLSRLHCFAAFFPSFSPLLPPSRHRTTHKVSYLQFNINSWGNNTTTKLINSSKSPHRCRPLC